MAATSITTIPTPTPPPNTSTSTLTTTNELISCQAAKKSSKTTVQGWSAEGQRERKWIYTSLSPVTVTSAVPSCLLHATNAVFASFGATDDLDFLSVMAFIAASMTYVSMYVSSTAVANHNPSRFQTPPTSLSINVLLAFWEKVDAASATKMCMTFLTTTVCNVTLKKTAIVLLRWNVIPVKCEWKMFVPRAVKCKIVTF